MAIKLDARKVFLQGQPQMLMWDVFVVANFLTIFLVLLQSTFKQLVMSIKWPK